MSGPSARPGSEGTRKSEDSAITPLPCGQRHSVSTRLAQAPTADHTRSESSQGCFASGDKVTQAPLSGHGKAAGQITATRQWAWGYVNPHTAQCLLGTETLNGSNGSTYTPAGI